MFAQVDVALSLAPKKRPRPVWADASTFKAQCPIVGHVITPVPSTQPANKENAFATMDAHLATASVAPPTYLAPTIFA
jgi:hypothetical protein